MKQVVCGSSNPSNVKSVIEHESNLVLGKVSISFLQSLVVHGIADSSLLLLYKYGSDFTGGEGELRLLDTLEGIMGCSGLSTS